MTKEAISEVYNMDCIAGMKQYPDKYFDFAICDIEYGIGASKPSKKPNTVVQKNGSVLNVKQSNYEQKDWDFKKSTPEYFEQLFRVSKKQIIFGGNYYGLEGGYLVWDKLNGFTDQYDCELAWLSFTKRTDLVYYMWSGMIQGETPSRDVRKALRQIGNKKLNEKRIHPTQKPIILYEWLLNEYAKDLECSNQHCEDGIVDELYGEKIYCDLCNGDFTPKILDTHGGSMSSVIACLKGGYNITCFEIDREYYNKGKKRIEAFISQGNLFMEKPEIKFIDTCSTK